NIKIRGVADMLPSEEHTHFIRRLTAFLLPTRSAKQFSFDGVSRIAKSPQAP
ncbi:Hypothetical predicted protein, partial [Pelobates cultripes]